MNDENVNAKEEEEEKEEEKKRWGWKNQTKNNLIQNNMDS